MRTAVLAPYVLLHAVAAQAPVPGDDRRPAEAGAPPAAVAPSAVARSAQAPAAQRSSFQIDLMVAAGRLEHATDGSQLDGETDAALIRLRFEGFASSGFGAGFEVEGIASDDDLFAENGFLDTSATSGEAFAYAGYRLGAQRFRMPIRAGLYARSYVVDQAATGELELLTFGIKFAVQPELSLIESATVRFSTFLQLAFGGGGGEVETEPSTLTWDTSTTTFALDLGLRLQWHVATLVLAYVYRFEDIHESDLAGGSVVRAMESEFQGLGLSLGVTF